MADPVQDLIRALKSERCPDSVGDKVAQRLTPTSSTRSRGIVELAWGIPGVALAFFVGWAVSRPAPPTVLPSVQSAVSAFHRPTPAIVSEQTHAALLLIGRTLIEAGTHTENVLRTEALPPLIENFTSAKTKLIRNL